MLLYICGVNRNSQQKLIKMPPREELRTRLGVIYFSMTINGKIHCFFEQSGVFKNEFRKLGYEAYDYDIQNNFGETDYVIDLFAEIEKAYSGGVKSVFDTITPDDLILAFFPCIYFTGSVNPCYFRLDNLNYRKLSVRDKFDTIIKRADNRNHFYKLLYKLVAVCEIRGLRMVVENPFSELHYLHNNFLCEPSVIDKDRTRRGDYFKKPTGFWFFNCEPTNGASYQAPKYKMRVWDAKSASKAGLCSEERSMISPDYARNFICDFIIGKSQTITQPSLFDSDSDFSLPDKT